MSTEIALVTRSSFAGAISAVFIDNLLRIRSNNKKHARPSSSSTDIRAELLSLLLEEASDEAITYRVCVKTAPDGYDRQVRAGKLLLKYKQQLDSLNQKVAYLQPVADFSDVRELRTNLVSFLEDRISVIDKKLLELLNPVHLLKTLLTPKANHILVEASKVPACYSRGAKRCSRLMKKASSNYKRR